MSFTRNGFLTAAIAGAVALAFPATAARADDTIKVGLILESSGPFASQARQIANGARAYIKAHGDTVGGKKIELIVKDMGGPAPDVAKRLAQELVTRDKVQFLAGFGLTPNALAVAPVATEAKVPMIIMNAATSIITTKSPYIVRVSFTLPQVTAPMAEWAAKNKIKQRLHAGQPTTARASMPRRRSRRSSPPHGGEIVGSVQHAAARTPTSRPSSSASRTPSRRRCSSSCPPARRGRAS